MNTDALIDKLASNVPPVRRHAARWRILFGLLGGGAATVVVIGLVMGFRPDLGPAMRGAGFWIKWGYTIAIGVCAVVLALRLAGPETHSLRPAWLLAVPFALLAIVGAVEMAHAPSSEWLAMWLGRTGNTCSWSVLALSAPIFIGLLWSFRQLAPSRLRAAGAAAGLAAGAWASTLYCLHCPEVSAIFVLTWYTSGIVLAATVGALLGPRLLRW